MHLSKGYKAQDALNNDEEEICYKQEHCYCVQNTSSQCKASLIGKKADDVEKSCKSSEEQVWHNQHGGNCGTNLLSIGAWSGRGATPVDHAVNQIGNAQNTCNEQQLVFVFHKKLNPFESGSILRIINSHAKTGV